MPIANVIGLKRHQRERNENDNEYDDDRDGEIMKRVRYVTQNTNAIRSFEV